MSNSEKIFCLGFSKTGTTSLEEALQMLGFNVCRGHWQNNHTFYLLALWINRDYEEIHRMTRYWDAFADGPWGGTDLYLKLTEWYPEAKYVLTERDPEKWYVSLEKLLTMFDLDLDTALQSYHARGMYGSGYYFERLFDIRTLAGNKEKIVANYVAYNQGVKKHFASKGMELLTIDVDRGGMGWHGICAFIGRPIPALPFPHQNRSERNPYLSNVHES